MEQLPSFKLLAATCEEGLQKLLDEASQADKARIKFLEEELKEKDKTIKAFHDKDKNYEKYKTLYQDLLIHLQAKVPILEAQADLTIEGLEKTIESAEKTKKAATDLTALVVRQLQPSPPEVLTENVESLVGDTSAGHRLE